VHWSFEEPAAVEGDDGARRAAFRKIRDQSRVRVEVFSKPA
jgi:hypothetical protein